MLKIISLLLLLSAPLAHSTQIYTWKDENGVTHFSQEEPQNQTADSIEVKEQKPASQPNTTAEQPTTSAAESTQPESKPVMAEEAMPQPVEGNTAEQMAEQEKPEPVPVQPTAQELKAEDDPAAVSN